VEHPELEDKIRYCGPFIKLPDAPIGMKRRPPLIGEHNKEINEEMEKSIPAPEAPPAVHWGKTDETGGEQALEGLKIADFTWSIVGPLTAKHLADHGATVVRVESHARLGINRVGGPYKDNIPGYDRSSLFTLYNTSKYGMSLNMDNPKAREVALRLILWSDVMLESFSPGVMEKLGLDYATIRKEKPDIIYMSTSCYGQDGPIANTPGFGQMATAQSGITNLIGWPDMPTVTNILPQTDFISPPFLVSTIMAALDYRSRTGKGIYMEQSQMEAGVHFFAPPVMDYTVNDRIMVRDGNHYPHASPHAVYPCRGENRWCAISIFSDEEWDRFCEALGNPSWTGEERFATLKGRKENEEDLDRLVGEWTMNFSPVEVMEKCQKKGIAAGVVQNPRELYEDPQLQHFGFLRYLDHPILGVHAHQGPPFILTKTPDRQFTAPCLGEHNEYVYKELLGYTDEEIEMFLIEGVISTDADIPEFGSAF
jgi:benzylsuccinate CoA-transferase BbsF subunit